MKWDIIIIINHTAVMVIDQEWYNSDGWLPLNSSAASLRLEAISVVKVKRLKMICFDVSFLSL